MFIVYTNAVQVTYWCFILSFISRASEDVRESLLSSAANELRDIEQTLMKHIAMELRDEDPHQFVNAYTSGKVTKVYVTTEQECARFFLQKWIWSLFIFTLSQST